jgi:CRISPR-associated protein Cas1
MLKRTLYFGNPAYLQMRNQQMIIGRGKDMPEATAPIEDIGIVILDHQQITLTQPLIQKLLENNVALISCDENHHPIGLMLNLDGHTLQSQKFKAQIEASLPLKKQLWQQTVEAKIGNQAGLFKQLGKEHKLLLQLAKSVKSGDSSNKEGQAAAYYWKNIFDPSLYFRRERYGPAPNNTLNYGYTILRATVARSLVGSGLLPTLGIFHRNQYNAYCLADDIMEPYRPFVDRMVLDIIDKEGCVDEMSVSIKRILLGIPAIDVLIDNKISPLMNAVQRTTASVVRCFEGEQRKIMYPEMTE